MEAAVSPIRCRANESSAAKDMRRTGPTINPHFEMANGKARTPAPIAALLMLAIEPMRCLALLRAGLMSPPPSASRGAELKVGGAGARRGGISISSRYSEGFLRRLLFEMLEFDLDLGVRQATTFLASWMA